MLHLRVFQIQLLSESVTETINTSILIALNSIVIIALVAGLLVLSLRTNSTTGSLIYGYKFRPRFRTGRFR